MEEIEGRVQQRLLKEKQGGCGRHTVEDLRNLSHVESNKTFLASRRKKDMVGYHNIATTCYDCGVEF